jgi:hypothetical protein
VVRDAWWLGYFVCPYRRTADAGDWDVDGWRERAAGLCRAKDGCFRGPNLWRRRILVAEESGIKHHDERDEKEEEGNSHRSSFFHADTNRQKNRKEHAAEEHQFRRPPDSFASRRQRLRLFFILTFKGQPAAGEPLRQPTEREPAPRTEPHLLRDLLLTTIRTVHKRSRKVILAVVSLVRLRETLCSSAAPRFIRFTLLITTRRRGTQSFAENSVSFGDYRFSRTEESTVTGGRMFTREPKFQLMAQLLTISATSSYDRMRAA